MGWGEAASAIFQIVLWFLNWKKEKSNDKKIEKAVVIQHGVNAVLSSDNQQFLFAVSRWKRLRQG